MSTLFHVELSHFKVYFNIRFPDFRRTGIFFDSSGNFSNITCKILNFLVKCSHRQKYVQEEYL